MAGSGSTGWFSIRRLRYALVTGAAVLLLVVVGFVGYARYRAHRYLMELPGRLGINITQETDHVSYSQSWQGRTVFTVHAAKQIQHKDGKITLRDVGIVLYGRTGDRADRIHGSEFEYDQKAGVMSAAGEVFLELAPPLSAKSRALGAVDDESRMIHVKTSGLVFRQKEETAMTDNLIEFRTGSMTGTAVGARYDSTKGAITLQSLVRVSGLRGGPGNAPAAERPMVMTASHAELDREGNVVRLESARAVVVTDKGTQQSSAQHAVVHLAPDGTPQRVEANGDVTLTGESHGIVTTDRMELELGDRGQPRAAHLMGMVRFMDNGAQRQQYGKSNDARIAFDREGNPVHALITGKVEANVTESNSLRWLGADRVDLALAGGGKAPVVVRGAQASAVGGARLRLVDANVRKGSKGKATNGVITTSVKADLLTARLGSKAKTTQITGIDGTGRTVVERTLVDETGQTQWHEVSSGDALLVDVRPVSGGKGREELARAEQHGSVRIVREAAAKGDATGKLAQNVGMEREDAQGDNAVYDASSNHLTMMGQVSVADADSRLFADRVEMDRASGDATAEGNVRVSYLQAGSVGEPVHVLAARAVAHKATGLTEFFAATGGNARMWQGGSQVQASVLEFDRNRKTLRAREVGAGAAVKTVLIDTAATRVRTGMLNKQTGNAPVRVLSRELLYSDAMRQVTFRGAVQLTDQDGVMRAQEATVFLAPKDGAVAKDASAAMSLGGRVERMVATGNVELEQPGRRASGDKLVYTASDKTFVLTGTNTAPPKLTDEAQGSVTGAQLRFRSGDDSVEVLSGDGSQRVRTETRIKQKESQ